jgi:hypothetical protein
LKQIKFGAYPGEKRRKKGRRGGTTWTHQVRFVKAGGVIITMIN